MVVSHVGLILVPVRMSSLSDAGSLIRELIWSYWCLWDFVFIFIFFNFIWTGIFGVSWILETILLCMETLYDISD
jgi:hypothetical protein